MVHNIDFKQSAASLWGRLSESEIPIHSLLVSHGDELLWETYGAPYLAHTHHRMFSITKSFCALAVGCMDADDIISLDDSIAGYFTEYLPSGHKLHPYLADMTIRHMLTMQTCHSATTYKLHTDQNWVESFFITPPTHRSGQIFLYDTSSSHTLAALVKKLTGMGVLDYLRNKFLDQIGFSKEAYIINDPFGSEMGGSGLMATPMDLMKTAKYLMKQIHSGKDRFAAYMRDAVSFQVPTLHAGQTVDEQQGYGYQFWRTRGGFAMYGMGGQYALFYPELNLNIVITADSQNIKGGSQRILDHVYEMIASANPIPAGSAAAKHAANTKNTAADITYSLQPNKGCFSSIRLQFDLQGGSLRLEHPEASYTIPFGWNDTLKTDVIANYNQRIASSGMWTSTDTLLIRTQLADECVGSLTFMIKLRPDGLTLWMKKIEETYFHEFDGFAETV